MKAKTLLEYSLHIWGEGLGWARTEQDDAEWEATGGYVETYLYHDEGEKDKMDEPILQQNMLQQAMVINQGKVGKRFTELIAREVETRHAKAHDYSGNDSGLDNFKRVSKILALYPGLDHTKPEVVAMIYKLKQFDAVMLMLTLGHKSKVGEDLESRLRDDAIYDKIITMLVEGL